MSDLQPGPRRDISPERKTAYYAGNIISGVGALLFLSVFVTFALNFGNFNNFESQMASSIFRAVGGMILIVIGQVIANIGRSGVAGSGVILDPQRARRDLEPWNRAQGGMLSDTLEEAAPALRDIVRQPTASGPIVKVRCPHCRELNDEDAKFCKGCGTPI